MNPYPEGHAELFSGDVLESLTDCENRHLGRLGNDIEERHLILEEEQEEWKAEKYSALLV